MINEPLHYKTNKMACMLSEDLDRPWHPPSLIGLHCALSSYIEPNAHADLCLR